MNFIACAIQEACIYKGHTVFGGSDTFLKIDACAAFFVHQADFYSILGQSQKGLNTVKDFIGKAHFFGPMHFGFYDVNGSFDGISALAFQIMQRNQHGYRCIHQTFGDFIALMVQDGRIGHKMAHVTHPKECAPFDRQG